MSATVRVLTLAPGTAPGAGIRSIDRARIESVVLQATGATSMGRLCARCGSGDHGQPWVRGALAPTYVSLSYTRGLTVAAWSSAGAVGIDVERATDRDAGVYGDLSMWTRAEAILKATGEGLRRDPGDLPDVWSRPLVGLPPEHVGSIALLNGSEPDQVTVTVEVAEQPDFRWVAYTPLRAEDQPSGR